MPLLPAPTRTPQFRSPGTPAYYLARPATWWLTAFRRQPQEHLPHGTVADPARAAPARLTAVG